MEGDSAYHFGKTSPFTWERKAERANTIEQKFEESILTCFSQYGYMEVDEEYWKTS